MKSKPITQQLRDFGLPEHVAKHGKHGLRYQSNIEKGVYWWFFSNVRKLEDFIKYGKCVSCGKAIRVVDENAQAGHFVPAGNCGFALVFHPQNVNLECSGCNGFDEGHLIGYAFELDRRYGEGTAQKLHKMKYSTTKEWSRLEYKSNISMMRERYENLLEQGVALSVGS